MRNYLRTSTTMCQAGSIGISHSTCARRSKLGKPKSVLCKYSLIVESNESVDLSKPDYYIFGM